MVQKLGAGQYDVYRDLYDVDIAWDRASNVTRVEDNVYDGWDVGYSLDGRDRLTAFLSVPSAPLW